MTLLSRLASGLDQRRQQQLYRSRRITGSAAGRQVSVDGRMLLSFCSNDYLGLANDERIRQAFVRGIDAWGCGSGSAHLVAGHTRVHHELEERLADFSGYPRALLFSSGYMANQGILTALTGKGDVIFQDRLNHASLIDAGLLSAATLKRYQHADSDSLQRQVNSVDADGKLVVTDGVFSMDGDQAPLQQLSAVCEASRSALMVDDAHGFGVLGDAGRGSVSAAGLDCRQVPLLMATLGKAAGCAGAFVAGDEAVIETLIQQSRSYIYTTAPPPALASATLAALDILQREDERRQKLQELIRVFRRGAEAAGLRLMPSETAIQPLLAGSSSLAVRWSRQLERAGILVTAIRPPTVPEGTARLRITLSAAHTFADVDYLLAQLAELSEKEHDDVTLD